MKLKNKRIVIKLGTSTLAHSTGRLNIRNVTEICRIISDLKNAGNEIIMVSSGAIGMGVGKLNLNKKPDDIPTKQAAAAIGQCELMYVYDKLFSEYSHTVAQLLITGDDLNNEERYNNFTNTVNKLLELSVIPIINENDTIGTDEIVIGDNDTLAAIAATSLKADLLVILSDIEGLYTADPRKDKNAKQIKVIEEITPEIEAIAGTKGTALGTGGMQKKIAAAKIATAAGCDMIIANGRKPKLLYELADGKQIGSIFLAKKEKQNDN